MADAVIKARFSIRKLLDAAHVLAQRHLNWRYREQSAIEGAALLARIAFDVVEVHARQSALRRLDVDLEVLIPHLAQNSAAIVGHEIAARVALP